MQQFLEQLASGLANGAIYACVALALVMIYVSTDHLNFAQGEMAMFSTYISWQLMAWGLSFWVAFVLTIVISFAIGVLIERVILRPLHNAPVLSVVVVFIGLLAICNSMAGAIWSYLIKEYPSPFPKSSFGIAGVIGGNAFVTSPSMAASVGTIVFVVAVVGGMGSLAGAFIASLLIGLLQTFAVTIDSSLADLFGFIGLHVTSATPLSSVWKLTVSQMAPVLPYLLMVVMMIVRPRGLMGTREG